MASMTSLQSAVLPSSEWKRSVCSACTGSNARQFLACSTFELVY